MTECLLGVVGIKPSVQEVMLSLPVKLQIIKHRDQRNQRDHGEMFQRRCRRFNSGSGVDVRMLLEKCKKKICVCFFYLHTQWNMKIFQTRQSCCTFGGQMSFIGSENVFIISFSPSGWNWGNIWRWFIIIFCPMPSKCCRILVLYI